MSKDKAKHGEWVGAIEDPLTELLSSGGRALIQHWIHIRTTNPIESRFATIRPRTTRTKNCVSRNTLLGLVFQLALMAEKGWRRIRGFTQLPDVVNGVRFQDGIAVIQESEITEEIPQIAA